MLRIIESLIKGNTTEQLDETFEELTKAISLRSAQGMGTDEALSDMLAALTAERNTRPPRRLNSHEPLAGRGFHPRSF